MLQTGVAIENANALVKVYGEQQEVIGKVLKQNALRVSQIESISYKLSYLVASSMEGAKIGASGAQPLDMALSLNIDLLEFPKIKA